MAGSGRTGTVAIERGVRSRSLDPCGSPCHAAEVARLRRGRCRHAVLSKLTPATAGLQPRRSRPGEPAADSRQTAARSLAAPGPLPQTISPATNTATALAHRPVEITLAPLDNRALANLCGPLDANLRQIEAALDVTITHRGERFAVAGAAEAARHAASALTRLYAKAGDPLSVDDVQLGIIEITQQPQTPAADAAALPALRTRRADLHGRTPNQTLYLKDIAEHDITFGIGPAGTGKTYLAVACAVDALERDLVKRLVLVRPAVEAGERLGFLPGDLAQKVDPYLRPLYDALYDLMGFDKTGKLFERGTIEIAPLAYMRGRTLNHSFIILDEAQNTTPEQMKMFLTRIGFGTRAVITGDVTQIDLARGQKSGLVEADRILAGVRGIAFTRFTSADVVRHPLVQKIINAYEREAEAKKAIDGAAERAPGRHER
ncbi:MAG: PhoH family protein [Betaproteobacteria bacterium]|nr:PhoH family protein [Betaproteobacteria bacterium]